MDHDRLTGKVPPIRRDDGGGEVLERWVGMVPPAVVFHVDNV